MIRILIALVVIAAIAWFIAKRSRDTRATLLIIASVPLSGFIGGYCGSGIGYVFLHLAGRDRSHNDLIPFAAAGMLGIGCGSDSLSRDRILSDTEKNEMTACA
jgi:hypothetical protein